MPIKHQIYSYRNKNGVKFICWGDYPTKGQTETQVDYFVRNGLKAFKEKHIDYYRLFVEMEKGKELGLF